MSWTFFLVGGVIFAAYIYFTIWNIFNGAKKNKEENYPDYYARHGQDSMDMDGMGNFSRFPKELQPRTRVSKKISKSKTKEKV